MVGIKKEGRLKISSVAPRHIYKMKKAFWQ